MSFAEWLHCQMRIGPGSDWEQQRCSDLADANAARQREREYEQFQRHQDRCEQKEAFENWVEATKEERLDTLYNTVGKVICPKPVQVHPGFCPMLIEEVLDRSSVCIEGGLAGFGHGAGGKICFDKQTLEDGTVAVVGEAGRTEGLGGNVGGSVNVNVLDAGPNPEGTEGFSVERSHCLDLRRGKGCANVTLLDDSIVGLDIAGGVSISARTRGRGRNRDQDRDRDNDRGEGANFSTGTQGQVKKRVGLQDLYFPQCGPGTP